MTIEELIEMIEDYGPDPKVEFRVWGYKFVFKDPPAPREESRKKGRVLVFNLKKHPNSTSRKRRKKKCKPNKYKIQHLCHNCENRWSRISLDKDAQDEHCVTCGSIHLFINKTHQAT